MTALLHPAGYTPQRESRRRKPQVDDLDVIAEPFHRGDSLGVRPSTQCALPRKVSAQLDQPANLAQEQPCSSDSSNLGAQWRQPSRDQVCVHEIQHACVAGQILFGERCFARSVRAGNDKAAWPSSTFPHSGRRATARSPEGSVACSSRRSLIRERVHDLLFGSAVVFRQSCLVLAGVDPICDDSSRNA